MKYSPVWALNTWTLAAIKCRISKTKFSWENSQLEMDAVFKPGIDTFFSPTTFDDLSMGGLGSVENHIVLDEE